MLKFVQDHKRTISLLALAVVLLSLTMANVLVRAAEPTDSAGVLDAGATYVTSYNMWVNAAFIAAIGFFGIIGLVRVAKRLAKG